MKITVIAVGKLKEKFLKEGTAHYLGRIKKYCPTEVIEIKEAGLGTKADKGKVLEKEEEAIGRALSSIWEPYQVLLDERGGVKKTGDLVDLIGRVTSGQLGTKKNLVFIIGSSWGISQNLKGQADSVLSLSEMTLPHQLARLVLLEQIYRAWTIIRGEPYHH